MTTKIQKEKKGNGDINITIETNIFNKNKDKDKPKPKKRLDSDDLGASGLVESVKNPTKKSLPWLLIISIILIFIVIYFIFINKSTGSIKSFSY